MPLRLLLNDAGLDTKVIAILVGSLDTVHHRVVLDLTLLDLSKRTGKQIADCMSISTMMVHDVFGLGEAT